MSHTAAWTIWALAAAACALTIRNPLYLSLIALACWIVQLALGERETAPTAWRGLLKIGALVWLVTIPFNALMIHEGEHVLFSLPSKLPLIGGPITLEAVLAGAVSGLALWTVLLVFSTFNIAVDATELLRALPPSLLPVGTVASIALTFVPRMVTSTRDIREAQLVRGHRVRGWRDWLPLFMPLLATSFEHALQLAESMEARGFGAGAVETVETKQVRERAWLLGGLALVLAGMLVRAFWPKIAWFGAAGIIVGALVILQGMRALGRGHARSRYRPGHWSRGDVVASLGAVVAAALPLMVRAGNRLALTYYPYPPYPLAPGFDSRIGVALCLLVTPALVELLSWTPATVDGQNESHPA